MRIEDLEYLRELYNLGKIANRKSEVDLTKLEADFINYSKITSNKTLIVKHPKMYKLNQEMSEDKSTSETLHFASMMSVLGLRADIPEEVDITGDFHDNQSIKESLVFFTTKQIENAELYDNNRAFLFPLVELIYDKGHMLLQNFTMYEAVYGKYKLSRGGLDLNDIFIYPDQFSNGPYRLSIELDTPSQTISKLSSLENKIKEYSKDPKSALLGREINKITDNALELRRILGSLSRYTIPETTEFSVNIDSCYVRNNKTEAFYLYSENRENVLVYFGEPLFKPGYEPSNLIILKGDEHQHTLARLLELGFYKPSMQVLERKLQDLDALNYELSKNTGTNIKQENQNWAYLLDKLNKTKAYFEEVINPKMQVEYVKKLSPELLQFMIFPNTDDQLIHQLLQRLSWNRIVRDYSNSQKFINTFDNADEKIQESMLIELGTNIAFSNQQNIEVNNWLYDNYSGLCNQCDIKFDVKD